MIIIIRIETFHTDHDHVKEVDFGRVTEVTIGQDQEVIIGQDREAMIGQDQVMKDHGQEDEIIAIMTEAIPEIALTGIDHVDDRNHVTVVIGVRTEFVFVVANLDIL